jgi:hypothetical protein
MAKNGHYQNIWMKRPIDKSQLSWQISRKYIRILAHSASSSNVPRRWFWMPYAIQSRHNLVWPCVVFHQRIVLEYDIYFKNVLEDPKVHKTCLYSSTLKCGTCFIIDGATSWVTKRRHDVSFPLLTWKRSCTLFNRFIQKKTLSIAASCRFFIRTTDEISRILRLMHDGISFDKLLGQELTEKNHSK